MISAERVATAAELHGGGCHEAEYVAGATLPACSGTRGLPAGSGILIAEDEESRGAVGWLSVTVLPFHRARHSGHLVIGVDTAAAGSGIGRDLLAAAEREASRRGLRRLELTVMTDNLRALCLYLSGGFQVEGLRYRALERDGMAIDEYYMGKLLSIGPPQPGSYRHTTR